MLRRLPPLWRRHLRMLLPMPKRQHLLRQSHRPKLTHVQTPTRKLKLPHWLMFKPSMHWSLTLKLPLGQPLSPEPMLKRRPALTSMH